MTKPQISVIVVTKNEEKNISTCLESLVAQDCPNDRYEIIVVDGASTDKTQDICRRYPIILIIAHQSGISHQRNRGVQAAKGDYVAFTDADCVAERMWLSKLIERIQQCDESIVGIGGPNLVANDDPPLAKIIGYMQETFFGSGGSAQCYKIDKPSYVDSIPNCNILYRKQIIAEERYDEAFSVGEDCELNFRLKRKGYKFLYWPDVVVWHRRPNSLKNFAKKMFSYGEAMGRITKKHKKVVRWYAFLDALAVLAVIFSYPIISFLALTVYIYALAVLLYAIALAISTAEVYQRCKSIKSIFTMILLPIQHLLYGLGFLKGLVQVRRAV